MLFRISLHLKSSMIAMLYHKALRLATSVRSDMGVGVSAGAGGAAAGVQGRSGTAARGCWGTGCSSGVGVLVSCSCSPDVQLLP